MTVKVTKPGKVVEYVMECPRCECVFEFHFADIVSGPSGYYVRCPEDTCRAFLTSEDGLVVS